MSIRGLKKCPCGVCDVLGWSGTLFSASAKFDSLQAKKVPIVLAKFINASSNIAAGQQPPAYDYKWNVDLPIQNGPFDDPNLFRYNGETARITWAIAGARPIKYGNRWFLAYIMCDNHDNEQELVEDSYIPSYLVLIDDEAQEIVHKQFLPSVDPAGPGPSGYWYAQYQGDYGSGGVFPFVPPQLNGIGRDWWVIAGDWHFSLRPNGSPGAGLIQRHCFSTGESAISLGSDSVQEGLHVIQLPAMATNDLLPWCISRRLESEGIEF